MLTGEESPDEGDAHICGRSVRLELEAARQHLGYCPQFDGLPHSLTGREVLVMYARFVHPAACPVRRTGWPLRSLAGGVSALEVPSRVLSGQ